jgi:hypothetical protein
LDKEPLNQLFKFIFSSVFKAACNEKDPDLQLVAIDSIHQCIHAGGENCLDTKQMAILFQEIKHWIEEIRENREDLKSQNPDEDQDENLFIREELGRESQYVADIAEIITAIVKNHKSNFLTVFNDMKMIDFILSLLNNPQSDPERQLAICIFDDIVEHTQEQSHPLFPMFIPVILQHAKSPHTGIRQAITFGCGVYAQFGGTVIQPYIESILNTLLEIISQPNSRNKTYASSTENAISSVGKIIKFQPQLLGNKLPEVVRLWLSWLPLEIDIIEAKVVHRQLCELIQSNNPHVFGENFKNLPVILNIFSDIISSRLIKKDTSTLIIDIVKNMQNQMPDVVNAAFGTLPQNKKDRLIRHVYNK